VPVDHRVQVRDWQRLAGQCCEAGEYGAFPGLTGFGFAEQVVGLGMPAPDDAGDDSDLPAIEYALADALMPVELGLGLVPAAGHGESAGAVGQADRPQPATQLGVAVRSAGERRDGYRDAVDDGVGAFQDGVVEVVEEVERGVAGAGADVEPGEVAERFEGLTGRASVVWPIVEVGAGACR
jgi:hypothetical protein